jgi:hypothetical protein
MGHVISPNVYLMSSAYFTTAPEEKYEMSPISSEPNLGAPENEVNFHYLAN